MNIVTFNVNVIKHNIVFWNAYPVSQFLTTVSFPTQMAQVLKVS